MAANIAAQRIQREFREVAADDALRTQYYIEASESNILNLKGYVSGPPDTPYEGGRYYLEMNIPESYPFSPPKEARPWASGCKTQFEPTTKQDLKIIDLTFDLLGFDSFQLILGKLLREHGVHHIDDTL